MYLTIFFIDVLTYLALFFICYFSGRSFYIVLTKYISNGEIPKKTLFTKTKTIYPILGLFIIGNSLIVLNFIIPLKNNIVFIFLLALLLINFTKINLNFSLLSVENISSYIIIPSILVISIYSTGWHYDAGFYHLNHQNWIRESNLILGMINIHWTFGMSSIFEYLSSILWFDSSFKLIHFLNIVFIHFFYNFIFDGVMNSKNKIITNSSFLLLIYSILDNFGINGGRNGFLYIQGVTKQDTAVAVLFVFITRSVFVFIKDNKIEKTDISIIFLLSLFTLQIKLSSVMLVFLVIYFIFNLSIKQRFGIKSLVKIAGPSILFSSIWIFKQYLITGCFIYPVNSTCINNFNWYSKNSTKEFESITRNASYSLSYYDYSFSEWYKNFFSIEINETVFINFFISFLALTIFSFYKNDYKYSDYGIFLKIFLFIALNTIYLVNYGPTPRYAMGTMLLGIVSLAFLNPKTSVLLNKNIMILLIILSAGLLVRSASYSSLINGAETELFDPRGIAKYFEQPNGYVKPIEGDQCWINLKCTMSTHDILIDESNFFKVAKRR